MFLSRQKKPSLNSTSCSHASLTYTHATDNPEDTFTCSECQDIVGVKADGRYNCESCKSDFCQECKPPPPYAGDKCSEGHKLLFDNLNNGKYKTNEYICDNCGSQRSIYIPRWNCSECCFDLCRSCKPIPKYDKSQCPKGHELILMISMTHPRFQCQHCLGQNYNNEQFWNCKQCKFKICQNCKAIDPSLMKVKLNTTSEYGIKGLHGRGVAITGNVIGSVCELNMELVYENTTGSIIETAFEWPVDREVSISGLSAIINGKEHIGKLMPKEEAKEKYSDTISSGDAGYMMEYSENMSRIKLTLGNIVPKAQIHLRVKMTKLIELIEGKWCLLLPIKGIDSEIPVAFEITIKPGIKLTSVECRSHEIIKEIDSANLTAKVAIKKWEPKDILLQYQTLCKNYPYCLYQKSAALNEHALFLSFVPDIGTRYMPGEHIFVLDASGSMSGQPLELATQACIFFLQSLPPGSYFNIYAFSDTFKSYSPSSVEYNEKNKATALENLKHVCGGGGTNILSPLDHILKKPNIKEGYPRCIYLLTDGEVNNKEEVIYLIRSYSSNTRVSSFGIGNSVDRDLIVRSAKAGKGDPYFIGYGEDISAKVVCALEKGVRPMISNLKVDMPNPEKIRYMTPVLDICSGDHLCVLAIYKGQDVALGEKVVLKGINGMQKAPMSVEAAICDASECPGTSLFAITAANLIMNNDISSDPQEKAELSLKYDVLSSETHYFLKQKLGMKAEGELTKGSASQLLAEEEEARMETLHDKDERKVVHSKIPRLKYGQAAYSRAEPLCCCIRETRCYKMSKALPNYTMRQNFEVMNNQGAAEIDAMEKAMEDDDEYQGACKPCYCPSATPMIDLTSEKGGFLFKPEESKVKRSDNLMDIISSQKIQGNWTFSDLASAFEIQKHLFESSLPAELATQANPGIVMDAWATILALAYLRIKHSAKASSWKLVEGKAKVWLEDNGVEMAKYEKDAEKVILNT